ncbi:MAG: hypothetical protein HC884_12880 [Chloroflexaceae bacterium]|nr:hypothetical protein [Chloroflexaceae bacterium]
MPVLDRDVVIGLITDQDILLKFRDVLGAPNLVCASWCVSLAGAARLSV